MLRAPSLQQTYRCLWLEELTLILWPQIMYYVMHHAVTDVLTLLYA